MEVKVQTVTVEPERIIPAVTEKQYVLYLNEHEARVLRALYGKTGEGQEKLRFLSPLDRLFPEDSRIAYDGIMYGKIEVEGE